MILQFKFKTVWKISKRYCESNILGMGKDMKINHSVYSPPAKYGETFFMKMVCMGNKLFWANLWGGMFYMGANDQIMQWGS